MNTHERSRSENPVHEPDYGAPRRVGVFERIPPDCIVHAVDDECQPLFECGDVAVISDEPRLIPEEGGWYLVEFRALDAGIDRGRRGRQIRVAALVRGQWYWQSPSSHLYRPGVACVSDGPYPFEVIPDRVLGRVIGIHLPTSLGRVSVNS